MRANRSPFPEANEVEVVDGEIEDEIDDKSDDRLWLIQCKREKSIGPKKLSDYIGSIATNDLRDVYGIIFVAACDFSKEARDRFREDVRNLGIKEWHLWGKAEIEDRLFRPQNDHLLFAYFGFSLQIRKRSLASQVRSRLAIKRKAGKQIELASNVLIRDATDSRYPYMDADATKKTHDRRRWRVFRFLKLRHDGLLFQTRRHIAFIDDAAEHWDYAETVNYITLHPHMDPWAPSADEQHQARTKVEGIRDQLPVQNRGMYEVACVIPFDVIIDIDAEGDDWFPGPQIITNEFDMLRGPFSKGFHDIFPEIERPEFDSSNLTEKTRVIRFPRNP